MPSLDEGESPELVDFRRRFWWTLAADGRRRRAGHVRPSPAAVRHGDPELGRARALGAGRPLGGMAVLRARRPVGRQPQPEHVDADRARDRRRPSSTASSPRSRPACSRPRSCRWDGSSVYFEAAAVIISLTLLGQLLELKARSQTSAAIKSLLGLAPKTARRINADGTEEDVPLTHVHVGDSLRVRPGEKVPVDGVVRRRQQLGRRVDADRRADAGGQARRATS